MKIDEFDWAGLDEYEEPEKPLPTLQDKERERARFKAQFCLALAIAPSEYDDLTQVEIEAFLKEQERINQKTKQKGR